MISLFLLKTFVWSLAIYGITQIISEATVFEPLRNFLTNSKFKPFNKVGELISCFLCCSVWVSFFVSIVVFSPSLEIWSHLSFWHFFFDGMIGSTIVWFFHIYEGKLSR